MHELVWTGRFEAEVQRIYEQHEEHEPDTGDRFYRQLLLDLHILEVFPRLGRPFGHARLRRLLAVHRRYAVLYTVESRGVLLHVLLDLREDPAQLERIIRQITQGLHPQ